MKYIYPKMYDVDRLYDILDIIFSIILWYYLPIISKKMKHQILGYIYIKMNRSEIPEFRTK